MHYFRNPILDIDSYKSSHYYQYPPHMDYLSSYIEPRGGSYPKVVFFGLQYFIKNYLLTPFTQAHIEEAEVILKQHGLPFNKAGFELILKDYGGFFPLEIQAVKEGSLVDFKNVLVQVINTDKRFPWLTQYVETMLLRAIWYPTTIATISYYCKKNIESFGLLTSDNLDFLPFSLHDFGSRGVSSYETSAIGGAGHLVNFLGTDNLPALQLLRAFYNEPMAGFSIPAAEHSTITAWGKDNEKQAYETFIDYHYNQGNFISIVCDSYDIWFTINELLGKALREKIALNEGRIVIRPDSGNPSYIVPEVIRLLMKHFGYSVNQKGYKLLPNNIRLIQGDGVDPESIIEILSSLVDSGVSTDNIVFGMGASLLQKVNRDTLKFAMKASAVCIDGEWKDVFKQPVTDKGKKSKPGRHALIFKDRKYHTVPVQELNGQKNYLEIVYKNGKIVSDVSLSNIREQLRLSETYYEG